MSQLFDFFHAERGAPFVKATLFSSDACKEAKELHRSKFTSSQFRNYFQELRGLEARFLQRERQDNEAAWLELAPQLHMLKAKLAYSSRSKGSITPEFRTFMDKLIDSGLASEQAFKVMMKFLEAVLAYFYAHENGQGGC